MSRRICITPATCNWWDKEVCIPCLGMVPAWWLVTRMDSSAAFPWVFTSEKCPVVMTANSSDFPLLPLHTLSFIRGGKTTSFSFLPITFPIPYLQLAARFPCVYPTQYLLLSLFLLEYQAGTFSNDGHIIATTACSAVLNIRRSRKSGCLLAWPSLIKKI